MYYIGIDLGTSAVKLLLMKGNGQIANIVSREYPIAFPHPGWSEQRMERRYIMQQGQLFVGQLVALGQVVIHRGADLLRGCGKVNL